VAPQPPPADVEAPREAQLWRGRKAAHDREKAIILRSADTRYNCAKKPPPASANWPARRVPAAGVAPALERLNESGRKDLAEARLGSEESPRFGAAGLDNDEKASLRQFVDKKPANN
jgi:hypothetical protein